MMEFQPSKGYSWKTSADQNSTNKKANATTENSPLTAKSTAANGSSVVNTGKSVLRAQETQVFRHWMDRAIETASIKVTQARQMADNPEVENALKTVDSPSSSSQQRGR